MGKLGNHGDKKGKNVPIGYRCPHFHLKKTGTEIQLRLPFMAPVYKCEMIYLRGTPVNKQKPNDWHTTSIHKTLCLRWLMAEA